MQASAQEKKTAHSAKIGGRAATGLITTTARMLSAIGSLFIILVILLGALFLSKFIHDNYETFQNKLREDPDMQEALINLINTFLTFINLAQKVIQLIVEIWDYLVPCFNLVAYLFYRVFIAVVLTVFGKGDQNNDGGDALPLTDDMDPIYALSGGMERFLHFLQCILIDILTILAGMFKVALRALGAMLVVVFEWLDSTLKMQWYRKEYCRKGATSSGDYGDDWQTSTDPDSGATIFDDGSGPGNTCPDNSVMIQGLIRFFEMVVNILRDVFIMVFPIVADLLKMIFDALMKILPQLMEGLVKIIEIFSPDQPLGKMLMFLLNFMIQVLGFFVRSCVLQLVVSIVMCLFNVAVSVVVNAIRAVLKAVVKAACLGGTLCKPKIPGSFMDFPSCKWSRSASCNSASYDSKQRTVTAICQVSTCSQHLKSTYHRVHKSMRASASRYSNPEDYQIDYYKACLATHAKNTTKKEETVEGHLFCRYLTEEVHKPVPLGIDPSTVQDPLEDSQSFCEDVQQSCMCRYESPICQSQTCCLTYYNVLVQQILADLAMENCDPWDEKMIFAQTYCVSRTHRSLDLQMTDLLGSATHCDGFVKLVNESCSGKPKGTPVDLKGIVGGMCGWVDQAGFCDDYRRPEISVEGLEDLAKAYNDHLRALDDQGTPRLGEQRRNGTARKKSKSPYPPTSISYYMDNYKEVVTGLEDHYNVAQHVMMLAYPALRSMILQKSFDRALGMGENEATLDPSIHVPDGRLRLIRSKEGDWNDISEGHLLKFADLDGKSSDWHFVGAHGDGAPYNPSSGCVGSSRRAYPGSKDFDCNKERMDQTGVATGGTIENVIGPGKAQDKIDDMVTRSSTQVFNKTTNRPTFEVPGRQYVDLMYDQDMEAPSNWSPADTQRDNQNPNIRIPLTRKDNSTIVKPPGFTVYGFSHPPPKTEIPKEDCPIPANFPWEKVFKKRDTFLTPLQAFVKKIPEWTEKNIPDKPKFEVPKDIQDGLHLMYRKRKNNLGADSENVVKATSKALKTLSDLKASWQKVKDKAWSRTKGNEEIVDTQESLWTALGSGGLFGAHDNPQGSNTDLCVNRLLNPYECCTDSASAYECCFGLLGCIPPPPPINIKYVDNLDFILNATCSSTSDIILSIFAIPRFVFGGFLWTFIFISPTWLRPLLFKILYPFVYDYGGKGIFSNFLSDMFCLIVNAYYLILIIIIILGLLIVDLVYVSFIREMWVMLDLARMDNEIARLKKVTDLDRKATKLQLRSLNKMKSLNENDSLKSKEE